MSIVGSSTSTSNLIPILEQDHYCEGNNNGEVHDPLPGERTILIGTNDPYIWIEEATGDVFIYYEDCGALCKGGGGCYISNSSGGGGGDGGTGGGGTTSGPNDGGIGGGPRGQSSSQNSPGNNPAIPKSPGTTTTASPSTTLVNPEPDKKIKPGKDSVVKSDTTMPIKVPCDPATVSLSTLADKVMDDIKNTPKMLYFMANVNSPTEIGMNIRDSSGVNVPYQQTTGTAINGTILQYDTSINHYIINSILHLHPMTGNDVISHSPTDIYQLISGFKFNSIKHNNSNFLTSIVVCSPNTPITKDTLQFALSVSDTTKAKGFYRDYPFSQGINLKENDWSTNHIKNSTDSGTVSLKQQYAKIENILEKEGYQEELLGVYAQVAMMEHYKMGVSQQIKQDGKFKTLSCDFEYSDANKTIIKSITIKICN